MFYVTLDVHLKMDHDLYSQRHGTKTTARHDTLDRRGGHFDARASLTVPGLLRCNHWLWIHFRDAHTSGSSGRRRIPRFAAIGLSLQIEKRPCQRSHIDQAALYRKIPAVHVPIVKHRSMARVDYVSTTSGRKTDTGQEWSLWLATYAGCQSSGRSQTVNAQRHSLAWPVLPARLDARVETRFVAQKNRE